MQKSNLIKEYNAQPAVVFEGYKNWVYSPSRKVNINDAHEISLIEDLDLIFTEFRFVYGWVGVSSNNVFWNATKAPLRVIQIPEPKSKKYLTIINPEITELNGTSFKSHEGCGSFPGWDFYVSRKSHVSLKGTLLEKNRIKPIEIEYGLKHLDNLTKKQADEIYKSCIVQHEYDHINGITLPHRSIALLENLIK